MDTERNLLFGVIAFQSGAIDADRLAETYAAWVTEPTQPLADLFVDRGCMTDEQRTEVEKVVVHELESYGGDPQATLAATLDGRSLEAIREVAASSSSLEGKLSLAPQVEGSHVVLGKLSPGESETRERYTLTHLHAKGGMGRVWLARDSALGRQIALKELRPDQTDNSIVYSRFLYEAKITAQLEHPGIVPVYELGEGKAPYYTMRFLRGRTLSEAIRAYHKKRAGGNVDSVELVGLLTAFAGVCHAVAYAHSRGIIHRDLKGQNVVLGDFGEVMVLDWGLAKRIGPDQQAEGTRQETTVSGSPPLVAPAPEATRVGAADDHCKTIPEAHEFRSGRALNSGSHASANGSSNHRSPALSAGSRAIPESGAGPEGTMQGQLLGTPAYMAPEQAQGHHDQVDERTDVYGLGAILYEILTGRPPFIGPKTSEVIRKVCKEQPIPPRQILAETAPGLEAICLRALQKAPKARYSSAAELAQEVQRWLADEPVQAYPEPWSRRALRWARRHKTLVSTAAGLLITATAALAVSTVMISRERNEAEDQGRQARQAVHLLTKVADIGFEEQLDPLQKEFLESALAYYEQFTSRAANNPTVRLEHARAYQQTGDIQRKLGHYSDSERAYHRALEILESLAKDSRASRELKQTLARTRVLLGDLLVRSGGDKGQAAPLYQQALEVQQVLVSAPAASDEDRLRLGQTLKSQGDLLSLNGKLAEAKSSYDKAITVLEQAQTFHDKAIAAPGQVQTATPKRGELRNELALAIDARGWIYRQLGASKQAGEDYRRAQAMLEDLVKEYPTVPRHREALARACNSLGLLEEAAGSLAAAEALYRRELPLVERLAQDFPDRPEHGREVARTLSNLGNVLARKRDAEAEPILRRAVDVNGPLAAKHLDDVQIRLDLAKDYQCLGDRQLEQGNPEAAMASVRQARSISEALVKQFPKQPRYADILATNLASLALALDASGQAGAEENFRAANAIYEKLVAAHPDNVDYKIGQVHVLRDYAAIVAAAGRSEEAETIYHTALNQLETKDSKVQTPEWLRMQALVLSNLGDLHRPGAEEALRCSIRISKGLLDRMPADHENRYNLALAQGNLGEVLMTLKRLPEAEICFAQASDNFEKLVAMAPKALDFQSYFGIMSGLQAKCLDQTGKHDEAKTALERAVEHQRVAVQLSKNGPAYRKLLGGHLVELAKINLKLGAYEEAARTAHSIPESVPSSSRAQGCLDAARALACLVSQASGDAKLAQGERDHLARKYLGRTIVFLREAIDANPKLADEVKKDTNIKLLESRPEFETMMNTLVNLGR
jgi:serine/threonine-protein kinase